MTVPGDYSVATSEIRDGAQEVKGNFTQIIWRAEDPDANPWVIAKFRDTEGRQFTVKGKVHGLDQGLTYTLVGVVKTDKFGTALNIENYSIEQPQTKEAILRFLDTVPGIGPTSARKLVDKFGLETLKKLEEEPVECSKAIDRFRAEVAIEAARYLQEKRVEIENDIAVRGLLVDFPNHIVRKAVELWRGNARAKITENPYVLTELPGVGFFRADAVARNLKVPLDSNMRIDAGVMFTGSQMREDGHTLFSFSELVTRTANTLTLDPEKVKARLTELADHWQMWPGSDTAQMVRDWKIEKQIAQWVFDRVNATSSLVDAGPDAEPMEVTYPLAEDQELAFKAFKKHRRLFILTGPPGTGKTFTVRAILDASGMIDDGENGTLACCAPTGKAAQRMRELTGRNAMTIHRLLGAVPSKTSKTGFSFTYDAYNKLPHKLIVVDEFSMVDSWLAWSLFQAINPEASVLIVGDNYQLPSVGPGAVLRDLIASGVPHVKLSKIKRQNPGGIVLACHAMVNREPVSTNLFNQTDLWLLPPSLADGEDKTQAVARMMVSLYLDRMPTWVTNNIGVKDHTEMRKAIQLLTPRRSNHPLGAEELNKLIHEELLRRGLLTPTSYAFAVGERVIQVKNDAELGVFNGDLGIVVSTAKEARTPVYLVQFDTKEQIVKVPAAGNNLQMAYALTVHKSQGSEWPVIIMPTLGSFGPFFDRPLLYTGISRASKMCVCVGSVGEFNAIATKPGSLVRRTGLVGAIKLELDPKPAFKTKETKETKENQVMP